jgi:hypothetical protein
MAMTAVRTDIAQDMLRGCLEDGTVIPGRHFRDELKNENLTLPAAWHVLRSGVIYKPPELNVGTGDWKYSVEGSEPDGKWLVIVFCFRAVDTAYLITVFSVRTTGESITVR